MGERRARGTRRRCVCQSIWIQCTNIQAGTLEPSALVAPLLAVSSPAPERQRHFSAFPLTSHLHDPILRLVPLHPALAIHISFYKVYEIHAGFQYKLYISTSMTVLDVVNTAIDELGLAKSIPIPGGGRVDYVLEEVYRKGDGEGGSCEYRDRSSSNTHQKRRDSRPHPSSTVYPRNNPTSEVFASACPRNGTVDPTPAARQVHPLNRHRILYGGWQRYRSTTKTMKMRRRKERTLRSSPKVVPLHSRIDCRLSSMDGYRPESHLQAFPSARLPLLPRIGKA